MFVLPSLCEISVDVTRHSTQTRGWATLIAARVRLRPLQRAGQRENCRVGENHPYLEAGGFETRGRHTVEGEGYPAK